VSTTIFLVRHAAHDNVGGYLAGRMTGVRLGADGRAQARRLAERMGRERIDAVHSSPRERTRETAEAIAGTRGLAVTVDDALDEVDFGAWSGNDFETLERDPSWRRWNSARSLCRTPAGESMLDVEVRVTRLIEALAARHDEGSSVVLVSHADVIKAAVCHVLGLGIDAWPRFDVAPASITTLVIGEWGAKVVTLNEVTP
jgi:broad specificity phosphatase PhoE